MSLILEALRKSEAERRRGDAPGLRVELPPLAPPARRGLPAWGWLVLAAAAVAAVLVFMLLRGVDPAAVDASRGTAAAGDVWMDAAPAPSAARDTAAPGDARPTDAAPVGDAGTDTLPHVERIVVPAPAPELAPAAAPAPAPAQPQTGADATPPPITPRTAPPTAAADANVPRLAAPAPAATPARDLPRVTELPASQRERLPALKMTMHMWNADPARRFVIVDGRRLVEGDRVGDATVRTIDADGVVLELEGQSLRLPLR